MNKLKGVLSQSGTLSRLLILVGFTCLLSVLGMFVWTVICHEDLTNISSLKWLQLIQSICMFVLPPFVLAYLCSENSISFLYFDKRTNWLDVFLVILFMIIIVPFVNLLGDLNHRLVLPHALSGLEAAMKASEDQAMKLIEQFVNVHNLQGLFFNVFLIALIPALGEELFFRSALQGTLQQKMNSKLAIWIAAIIFSAIHFQFYGFVPRMLLGAFFGYLLVWNGNIWLPIAAHFTNNALAVVFYYFKNNGYKLPDIDAIGTGNTWWLGCLSGVLFLVGFFYLKKRFQCNNNLITNQ